MPYIRTTVTISAAVHIDCLRGESIEEAVRRRENTFRDNLDENLRMLLAQARGPGGTITWQSKLTSEPPPKVVTDPERPPLIPYHNTQDILPPERPKDPRVKAELDAIKQGRPPSGGLE